MTACGICNFGGCTTGSRSLRSAPGVAVNESWARRLVCSRGGHQADLANAEFVSPAGAPWLVEYDLTGGDAKGRALLRRLRHRPWSLWRYRELLPLASFSQRVDLGEGGTPLVRIPAPESCPTLRLWAKEEAGNPAGSFKARGLSVAVNRARELGAAGVELPSAGNAAIALSMFAAAVGLPARVAIPSDSPRTIVEACRRFNAQVLEVEGTLVEAGRRLRRESCGFFDLSTLREPYRLEGKKTMGFELAEQFAWNLPDWIVYPTGGGTGLIGMHKAFAELAALGLVRRRQPRFVAVQMAGCAPIVHAFDNGLDEAEAWPHPRTRVWGLRVPQAIGDFLILRVLRETRGLALAVDEDAVVAAQGRLATDHGFDWGPEGVACWVAAGEMIERGLVRPQDRVVLFQTGHPGNYR